MIRYEIQYAVMEKVLNEDLMVLVNCGAVKGEQIELHEMQEDKPTGRVFFAKAAHVASESIVQIELSPFMEATDENGKVDRMPMIGGSANEKYVMPAGDGKAWQISVTGEKPVWIYRGLKWVQEITLSKLFFGESSEKDNALRHMSPPHTLHLKTQAQGGERDFKYTLTGEVKAGA